MTQLKLTYDFSDLDEYTEDATGYGDYWVTWDPDYGIWVLQQDEYDDDEQEFTQLCDVTEYLTKHLNSLPITERIKYIQIPDEPVSTYPRIDGLATRWYLSDNGSLENDLRVGFYLKKNYKNTWGAYTAEGEYSYDYGMTVVQDTTFKEAYLRLILLHNAVYGELL